MEKRKTFHGRQVGKKRLLPIVFPLFLFLLIPLNGYGDDTPMPEVVQQNSTRITGVVKDAYGEPVIGANVKVVGTTQGTITDFEGKFSINVSGASAKIKISFIGYKDKEVTAKKGVSLNIVLEEDAQTLGEVQVVAYGVQKKVSITGAISSMKGDDLLKTPAGSLSNVLSGQITGISSVQYSGEPGADAADIYVRGVATMNRFNRYQYEVRLLRAYYYFLLVRAYGDVPFTVNVLTEKEANSLSRTPASEVFDFIISECEEVAPELPVSYSALDNDAAGGSNPEAGRVTQGTALALKARAALYRASKLFSGGEDRNLWREAAVANKAVIDYCTANGIRLGKYTDIWGTDNYQASEMIFVRRIGDTSSPEYTNFPVGMENASSGNCPTQTLVDAYESKDNGDKDPRFGMTIACNGDKWPNTNPNPLETFIGGKNGLPLPYATPTGYYLKKYLDASTDISAESGSGGKRHNWVIFRLGEFYLNYAEAIYRYLGAAGATDNEFRMSACAAINKVRQRSDVQMPDFPDNISNTEFWERYKKERMVELAFEQHRFWDVRRWKEGGFTKIGRMQITQKEDGNFLYERTNKSLVWDDKMYFFPIPASEMRKNPNLSQNPGW